jgi:hypothetical protein
MQGRADIGRSFSAYRLDVKQMTVWNAAAGTALFCVRCGDLV